MKSILIITRFSAACANAAKYAIGLAKQMKISKIILFSAWKPIGDTAQEMINTYFLNNILKETCTSQFKLEVERIREKCPSYIEIESVLSVGVLQNCIVDFIDEHEVGYIVLGVSENAGVNKNIAEDISLNTTIPIVMVPDYCTFNTVTKTMLLSDWNETKCGLNKQPIDVFLDIAQPQLEVINYEVDFEESSQKVQPNLESIDRMINDFAAENNIQLIINLAKMQPVDKNKYHSQNKILQTKIPLMLMYA